MRSFGRFVIKTLLLIAVFVGLARAIAIRWWMVPTDDPWLAASVSPSLGPGDRVLLWRLSRPQLGDLVMCPEPGAPERIVVGRILGTVGDVLEVTNSGIILNNKPLVRDSGCDSFQVNHPRSGETLNQHCSLEDLHGDLYMRGEHIDGLVRVPEMKPITVPQGRFFLISDNRQFPLDSRDFGPVEAASCQETFLFRLWGPGGYFTPNRRFELIR